MSRTLNQLLRALKRRVLSINVTPEQEQQEAEEVGREISRFVNSTFEDIATDRRNLFIKGNLESEEDTFRFFDYYYAFLFFAANYAIGSLTKTTEGQLKIRHALLMHTKEVLPTKFGTLWNLLEYYEGHIKKGDSVRSAGESCTMALAAGIDSFLDKDKIKEFFLAAARDYMTIVIRVTKLVDGSCLARS